MLVGRPLKRGISRALYVAISLTIAIIATIIIAKIIIGMMNKGLE